MQPKLERKPRLLMLVQLPPPTHGAAVVNSQVLNSERIKESFDVACVDINLNRDIKTIRRLNAQKLAFASAAFFHFLRTLLLFRPDIIYITVAPGGWAFWRDLVLILVGKAFRRKIALHFHGMGVKEFVEGSPLHLRAFRLACSGATVFSLCEAMSQDLRSVVGPHQIKIIKNGIPDPYGPLGRSRSYANKRDPAKLLYISHMIRDKGPLFLVEALGLLKSRGVDFQIDFIGGWRDELSPAEFSAALRAAEIEDNVTVHGLVSGEVKFEYLGNASIFAYPTRKDAFPISILEAMSAGLAIVATPIGGIPEIITDGENGLIGAGDCVDQWADALERLIDNPALAAKLGEAARRDFEAEYTLGAFEERLCSALLAMHSKEEWGSASRSFQQVGREQLR
jgi:glycosyltransferase involved in cell wall biosynthesis